MDKEVSIHAGHIKSGFNPSLKIKEKLSKKILDISIKAADIAGSKFVVVHPGIDYGRKSFLNMVDFFNRNSDERFLFENMPFSDFGERHFFTFPYEIDGFLKNFKGGFVLDFAHSICTSNVLNCNQQYLIDRFMELHPFYFHVSGIDLNSKRDSHKMLKEGGSMNYVKKIPEDSYVVFESDFRHLNNRKKQIEDLEFFSSFL